MAGLLSDWDIAALTHSRPGVGQISPALLAQEAARQREQALYAQPTDPTVAGVPVSEYLPPHARPAWRGLGLLGEMFAPTATRDAAERGTSPAVGILSDVAGSIPMGKGLLAMAGLPGSVKGIRAFHGSPHDFERFDLSKIGTGEGAQAYGHGLYFAENEGVAKAYRDKLTAQNPALRSGYYGNSPPIPGSLEYVAQAALLRDGSASGAKQAALNWQLPAGVSRDDVFKRIDELAAEFPKPAGHMYEVNINANPEDFLDWDKPLSGQGENVRDAWDRFLKSPQGKKYAEELSGASNLTRGRYGGELTGEDLLKNVMGANESHPDYPARATEYYRNAGIPGIKYLDQGSRAAGDGSRNYVVFDDKLIEILRKYGIAPFALGGAAAMNQETEGAR